MPLSLVSPRIAALRVALPRVAAPLVAVLSFFVARGVAQEPVAGDGLAASVRVSTDALVAASGDPRQGFLPVWRACCSEHGSVEPLLRYLAQAENDGARAGEHDSIRRLLCRVARRAGHLARALRAVERIDEARRTVADEIARAEILDALGREADALALYGALRDKVADPAVKKKILLRCALMGQGVDGLAAFAKDAGNSPELRNEAAIVLALRGDQKTAIDTFVASGEGTLRFRQEIRRAEWAMEANLFDDAQAAAWLAVEHAQLGRDRKYALSVLASAYQRDGAVGELLERLERAEKLSKEARELWVQLLREEGRADDALRLFREAPPGSFDATMRRQLLEICRETGRAEVLVGAFERLIREEPENLEWRSGLSRHYLEQGARDKATLVWRDIEDQQQNAKQLMAAAFSLDAIGLTDVAERLARQAAKDADYRSRGLLFVFRLHFENGRQEAALAVLRELDRDDSGASVLAEVADGYERLGRSDLAVATLERLRASLGGFLGSDLEMKLAIQLSRVNREADALRIWRELWSRLRSTPRGRFVEDRMMTVAARTGTLAKIAIELEDKLAKGDVDTEGIELLVRLYIKVGDPASATEIVEEFMKKAGSGDLEVLKRKAKIYLSCQDYYHYEQVIHELALKDVEGRLDHLRELAMSQLERGRRDLTVALLPQIRVESGDDLQMADEFEAGIYSLCGMREKALEAYIKGMGRNPGRIDTYLLISNLMRESGHEMEAARMFQYLAQTASKDDLFTIAIDGLLNLRAQRGTRVPPSVVAWALRTTLERLAQKPDKFYLYRLVTDLAAELEDMPLAIRTLKSGLPIAGERRTQIMREIMTKVQTMDPASRRAIGGQNVFKPSEGWDATDYVMVGRRLLGQGDHVPPQTFMNLATVFLREDDVDAAVRTFNRAAEMLEYTEVLREAARVLEDSGRPKQALQYYHRLLASGGDDIALMLKIGTLEEQLGNLPRAFDFYHRGMAQILARKPRYVSHVEPRKPDEPFRFYFGGNVSLEDQLLPQFIDGMVLSASAADVAAVIESMHETIVADLETVPEKPAADSGQHAFANYPRLEARTGVWRRLVLSRGQDDVAAALDKRLLARFAGDRDLTLDVLASRAERGLERSARELLAASPFREEARAKLAAGVVDASATTLSIAAAARLVVPNLAGDTSALRDIMERVDTGKLTDVDKEQLPNLLAACVLVGARNPAERFARAGVRGSEVSGALAQRFQTVLNMAARLSPQLAKTLLREKMTAIAEGQPSTLSFFVHSFREIDASLGGGSLTSDGAKALILSLARGADRSVPYLYFTTLLGCVDAKERPALVKELHHLLSPTQRPRLLLDSINYIGPESAGDAFGEWFARSLKVALEASGENVVNAIILPAARGTLPERSHELALIALDVLDGFQPNSRNSAERVGVLLELGKIDEAFAAAAAAAPSILADAQLGTYAFQQMMRHLSGSAPPERVAQLLRKLAKDYPDSLPVRNARWTVLMAAKPEVYRAELEAAVADDPKDVVALTRLRDLEQRDGRPVHALRLLEKLVKLQPNNASHKRLLESAQRALQHPEYYASGKAKPRGRGGRRRAAAQRVSAAAVVLPSSAATAATAVQRVRVDPKGEEILALHAAGKLDEARRALRRYWRNFDAPNRYVVFPNNLRPGTFRQFEDKLPYLAEEVRSVLKVLAGRGSPQAREEMFDIVAADLVKRGQTAEQIAAHSASVLAGTASTDDVEVLLRLLDTRETDPVSNELMEALLGRSELLEPNRLMRLARLCVKGGQQARGAQLYRLAVLASPGAASTLAKESAVIEKLFGEAAKPLLLELIEDLSVNTQRYQFVNWANTAIELWERILTPDEAARKMLDLKQRITALAAASPYIGNRTPRGDVVALTLARAGRTADALEELSVWLCDEGPEPYVYSRVVIQAPAAARRVLDASGEWSDYPAWLRALGGRVLEWHAAGKLAAAEQVLGAVGQALWKDDAGELAKRCVDAIAKEGSDRPVDRIARANALRAMEAAGEAWKIEERLLAEQALPIARIPATVRHIAERDGPEAGLAAGAAAAEYTWTPKLLAFLAETASALGRADEAKSWNDKKATVEAATQAN